MVSHTPQPKGIDFTLWLVCDTLDVEPGTVGAGWVCVLSGALLAIAKAETAHL